MLFRACFLLAVGASCLASLVSSSLPLLVVDGFSWAENLAFDGLGSLFVSELNRGELHRIWLCGETYCNGVHASGFKGTGGLAVSPDGITLYAGVTFKDKTHGIISMQTAGNNSSGAYSVIARDLMAKPNGMQLYNGYFYCTTEGGVIGNGTVFTVSLETGEERIVHTDLNADGAWIDGSTHRLFIGQVKSMTVAVFDISVSGPQSAPCLLEGVYPGAGASFQMPGLQLLDDLTLAAKGGQLEGADSFSSKTQLLGADWLGKRLLRFSLDGEVVETIQAPGGVKLKELTSVRWGKGPGFDPNSVYVTEGGGLTEGVTSRRVVQIPMNV